MTRTDVCRLLGIAPKSLYLWERAGKVPTPRRDRRGWRNYSPADLRAIRRFLGQAEGATPDAGARRGRHVLDGLSARNQLRGTVVSVRGDRVLSEVVVKLGDGQEITSVITRRSVERLGVKTGVPVVVIIKATEVMLFR